MGRGTILKRSRSMNERPSFESIYMGLAEAMAERSTCSRLKVGAVITSTDYRKVLAVGYNGNAARVDLLRRVGIVVAYMGMWSEGDLRG